MRDSLGGDVPIPSGLDEVSLRYSEKDLPETLSRMYRWLHLLDMAITPAMLRQALTPDTDSEVAEALLRYFVRRREPSDINRDKTDLIATFLYRHPRVQGQWQQHGYGLDGSLPLSPLDRKSTRLNSSHLVISYAVFCLKKNSGPATGHARPQRPPAQSRGAC